MVEMAKNERLEMILLTMYQLRQFGWGSTMERVKHRPPTEHPSCQEQDTHILR
jgi:hypothetical protein